MLLVGNISNKTFGNPMRSPLAYVLLAFVLTACGPSGGGGPGGKGGHGGKGGKGGGGKGGGRKGGG